MASLGTNFVTAPIVGGALGYGIDWLIGTYPWGMVAGIALGFVSAFIEILRSSRRVERHPAPPLRGGKTGLPGSG